MSEEKQSNFFPIHMDVNQRIMRRVKHEKPKYGLLSKNTWLSFGFLIAVFAIFFIPNALTFTGISTADFTSYSVATSMVTIDGTINVDEYTSSYTDTKLEVEIYSEHDANNIYFGIVCPAEGWCALGFNDKGVTSGMTKADIKYGIMENGILNLTDRYTSSVGANPSIDPTSNIIDSAGIRAGGKTTFEFSIALNSGDEGGVDKNLEIGSSYTIIYAFHDTDTVEYHGTTRDKISFLISDQEK